MPPTGQFYSTAGREKLQTPLTDGMEMSCTTIRDDISGVDPSAELLDLMYMSRRERPTTTRVHIDIAAAGNDRMTTA